MPGGVRLDLPTSCSRDIAADARRDRRRARRPDGAHREQPVGRSTGWTTPGSSQHQAAVDLGVDRCRGARQRRRPRRAAGPPARRVRGPDPPELRVVTEPARATCMARLNVRASKPASRCGSSREFVRQARAGPLRVALARSAAGRADRPLGHRVRREARRSTGSASTPAGRVDRYHLRSPSYANWPAVALAAQTAIVPDFPLVNKSFELCYSCTDR